MLIIDLGSYPNLFHISQLISMLSILKGYKKSFFGYDRSSLRCQKLLSQCVLHKHDCEIHTSSNNHALYNAHNTKIAFSTSNGRGRAPTCSLSALWSACVFSIVSHSLSSPRAKSRDTKGLKIVFGAQRLD